MKRILLEILVEKMTVRKWLVWLWIASIALPLSITLIALSIYVVKHAEEVVMSFL